MPDLPFYQGVVREVVRFFQSAIANQKIPRLRFLDRHERLAFLDRGAVGSENLDNLAFDRCGDLVEELHRLHDADLGARIHDIAFLDERRLAGTGRGVELAHERGVDGPAVGGLRPGA